MTATTGAGPCQRWRAGRHSWRRDTSFDPRRYHVAPIGETTARAYVVRNHYSHEWVSAKARFGLFEGPRLRGVAVLSTPMHPKVLTNVFPQLESGEAIELGRFVLDDEVPANGETWLLARVFRRAAAVGFRGVVSFSDPVPRTRPDGSIVFPGHVGWIYEAANALHLGRSTPRTQLLLPDGTVFNERARSKIRAGERGSAYAERKLCRFGARPRRPGESGTAWLAHALADAGVRRVRHHGAYRYAFVLGSDRERRALRRDLAKLPAALAPRPYPKTVDSIPTVAALVGVEDT
jgi:hypothetical protein